jgi:hypothetical protein
MGPLWFLPGRLFGVYLYVPLIALAAAFAFLTVRLRRAWIALFFLLWLPWNYQKMREGRRAALTAAPENRAYAEQVRRAMPADTARIRAVVLDGRPSYMGPWGPTGLIRLLTRNPTLPVTPFSERAASGILREPNTLVVGWNRRDRSITHALTPAGLASDLTMARSANLWQLGMGWLELEGAYRWTRPVATATLARPKEAARLVLELNVGPAQFGANKTVRVEALMDGQSLGTLDFAREGWHAREWMIAPGASGEASVELRFTPPFTPGGEPLGGAVSLLALR